MTAILGDIYSYLSNKKVSLTSKTAAIVISLLIIIGLDIWLKASFRFRAMNRMSVVREANALIADTKSDSLTIAYAVKMRNRIVVPIEVPKSITLDYKPKGSRGRDKFQFLMSCSGLFAFILLIGAVRSFFRENQQQKKVPIEIVFANNIISLLMFAGVSYVMAFGMQFIPPIAFGWKVNYAIGFFLQILALRFIVRKLQLRNKMVLQTESGNSRKAAKKKFEQRLQALAARYK